MARVIYGTQRPLLALAGSSECRDENRMADGSSENVVCFGQMATPESGTSFAQCHEYTTGRSRAV